MRKLELEKFPSELGLIKFNSEEAINQIRNYSVIFPELIDDYIEDFVDLPEFVKYFKYLLINDQYIPTQDKFREGYIIHHKSDIDSLNLTSCHMEGLRCRLNRCYPSFVRDIVLSLQFIEDEEFKNEKAGIDIRYNSDLDLNGIDIYIGYHGKHYGLKCYTDTERSYKYLSKKKYRTPKFCDVTYIKSPLISKIRLKDGDDSIFIYDAIPILKVKYKIKFQKSEDNI